MWKESFSDIDYNSFHADALLCLVLLKVGITVSAHFASHSVCLQPLYFFILFFSFHAYSHEKENRWSVYSVAPL